MKLKSIELLSGLDRAGDASSQEPVADLPTPAAAETAPARAYTPKVPYPVPRKKSRKDLEDAKCKEMLKDLTVKLPLSDAVQMIPALKKYMKELISGKVAEDENVMLVSEECSAVLQNKVIKKRSDPGRFVLSVQIRPHDLRMLSLRSWLEREPDAVFCGQAMGYTKFKPTKVSLVFADRSTKFPVGILEDLHVQIGNTLIPADFVVLELDEEPKDPLILGRNFLCTAGAIIDVKGGIIDLHLGDIVMRFEMNKLLKKPMLDGQTYVIEDGSNLVDEVSEEMLLDDPLEVALTKAEGEYDFLNEEADGFGKMMDASGKMERLVAFMSLEERRIDRSRCQIDRMHLRRVRQQPLERVECT
ncbi:unnamed protein product [Microthlaspi erraticum]|uniref:Aspartic peptidase DDI1-type domain-containing protein n=1 Tax=Microthlaspi erraticum TaxID=1685480 RepID=A0A6D2J3K9_9BRAS|nr:unnamed protein product [Microthlaspi erraticum]